MSTATLKGQGTKGKSMADLREGKAKTKTEILEYLLNHPDGATTKELTVDFKLNSDTLRGYLVELVDNNQIAVRKEGRTCVYTYKNGPATSEVEELPESPSGRTFTEVIPAINCNQRDVVWISSRSGDGQFFRYLVITPWAKKATVAGIMSENDRCLDLNDTRFVQIGSDPETGENLYVDLSNICSRRYDQFGEKLMKVTEETMDEVKRVMARYHRIKLITNEQPSDIWKKKADELVKINKDLESKHEKAKGVISDLKSQLEAAYLEYDEKKQACEEAQKKINDLQEANKKLISDRQGLVHEINELRDKNIELASELDCLEKSRGDLEPVHNADVDALLWKISLLEKELECKDEMISTLRMITFKSLKGGE